MKIILVLVTDILMMCIPVGVEKNRCATCSTHRTVIPWDGQVSAFTISLAAMLQSSNKGDTMDSIGLNKENEGGYWSNKARQ